MAELDDLYPHKIDFAILYDLPARLSALEARVAYLEQFAPVQPLPCPKCGGSEIATHGIESEAMRAHCCKCSRIGVSTTGPWVDGNSKSAFLAWNAMIKGAQT